MRKKTILLPNAEGKLIPKENEGKDNFIARCTTDSEMKSKYDEGQRAEQCKLIWSEYAEPDTAEITMFGEVGVEITAVRLASELEDIEGDVDINLYTGGGDLFEGATIYSLLKNRARQDRVRIFVHGVAASAGAFIAMAGSQLIMEESAMLMIHNAWTMAVGDADDFRDKADLMDKQQQSMIDAFVRKTGKDEKEIKDMLDAETWMTAQEAVDMGFADAVFLTSEEDKVAASVDKHLVQSYKNKHVPNGVSISEAAEGVSKSQTTNTNNKSNEAMDEKILQALGIDKPSASADVSDVVASIKTLKNEKETLRNQLDSKAELVDDLEAKVDEKEAKITEMSAKVQQAEVQELVAEILDEAGVSLSDTHKEGLERRAKFYLDAEDEQLKDDMRSDMVTFAKTNGVQTGKSTLPTSRTKSSNSASMEDKTYEERLQAQAEQIQEQNPTMAFMDAVEKAKGILREAEAE